jgi:hypothetical protein
MPGMTAFSFSFPIHLDRLFLFRSRPRSSASLLSVVQMKYKRIGRQYSAFILIPKHCKPLPSFSLLMTLTAVDGEENELPEEN